MFWRMYAVAYDFIWCSPLSSALADEIAQRTGDAQAIVDLGCGTGLATHTCTGHVIGVDSSPAMLQRAKQRVSETLLAQADNTGLNTDSADVVVVANVLHLCESPADVLLEALRIVRPGGQIVVTWPASDATIASVAHVQRSLGWRSWRASLAAAAATAIGILSVPLGQSRRTDSAVREAVVETCGMMARIEAPIQLWGIQNLTTIKVFC